MKKIIISMLLNMLFIHLHAQSELPYKSLSDFKNDTTAFINYNFIDRAEQYKGKTLEFIVRDLQIPVKCIALDVAVGSVVGFDLNFYDFEELINLMESTINKPFAIEVNWGKRVPMEEDLVRLKRLKENDKIINNFKDFQIIKINVRYPLQSEYEQNRPKPVLRSTEKYDGVIRD